MPGTLNKFFLAPDDGGRNTYARTAPTYVDARVLAANTNETHTVPTGARLVVFSADGDFYACVNSAASVPAADVTDGSASELNPTVWDLSNQPVSSIGLISASARKVTLSFYK